MFIIVTYDLVDNKRRSRIAKVMKSYGYRVQKSVLVYSSASFGA